jgi:hypothetical protein
MEFQRNFCYFSRHFLSSIKHLIDYQLFLLNPGNSIWLYSIMRQEISPGCRVTTTTPPSNITNGMVR